MGRMELDELRAFVVVVQEGSISAAGRRLYRSQSAVTRQVQALEAEVGGTLLDRRSRPLAPTPLGRTVLERALRALAAIDELKGAAAAEGAAPSGELRIGTSLTLGDLPTGLPFARFRREFPRVALTIKADWSQHLLAALRDGTLDVVMLLFPPTWTPPDTLQIRQLGLEPFVVIAPRATRLRAPVAISRLAESRWIVCPEGCRIRSTLRQAFSAAGCPLNVAIELLGSAGQIELVAAGLGLGAVPSRVLRSHPRRRAVRTVAVQGLDVGPAAWFGVGHVSPLFKPAIEWLEEGIRRRLGGKRDGGVGPGAVLP
jgi:DNA-binding transcriptional LysR family regulator